MFFFIHFISFHFFFFFLHLVPLNLLKIENQLLSSCIIYLMLPYAEPYMPLCKLNANTINTYFILIIITERYSTVADVMRLTQHQSNSAERLTENCTFFQLQSVGSIPGDGNCFFHAISHQLKRLNVQNQSPSELRKLVVNYLRENPQIQVKFSFIFWYMGL